MYLLPIYLTLISFFVCFFFGRSYNRLLVCIFSSSCVALSFFTSLYIFYETALQQSVTYIIASDWIQGGFLQVKWEFLFDSLTSVMLIVILCISMCAHIYSIEYMASDPHQIKFMSYLSLFTFFMLLLVTASNYILLFVGWEGVGICSYLLINFWYTRLSANKSAIMAMFVNKVGDISLLIAFGFIYAIYYSFDYSIIFTTSLYENPCNIIYTIVFLFVIGAVGKSAQVGLHMWLPEAMEGPTPVSSLIHAATMVTAGIFLLVRSNLIVQNVSDIFLIIIALGSITAFMGSTIGIFQYDIKKIIAYSTCSQLGYMFLACGLSGYNFSMYHLTNHAFFKALLFLTAGYIIHAMQNEQDLRKFGGLLQVLPFAYICITIGSLSLLGFPFLSGYFSKEKIIELFYAFDSVYYLDTYKFNILFFFQLLANVAVIFTILYSVKVSVYTFFYTYNNNKNGLLHFHFSTLVTTIPLLFLAILSIASGYLLEDMMVGIATDFWKQSIYSSTNIDYQYSLINYFEFNKYSSKLPIISILYFMLLFFFVYYYASKNLSYIKLSSITNEFIFQFLNKKYLVLNKNVVYPLIDNSFRFAYNSMYTFFDKGLIEMIGPFGIVKQLNTLVTAGAKVQTGFIYHYSGFILLGIILIMHILFITL